ncbi:MAG: ABC transporter ATP-binding protein, partial [Planctomycetales bacterium]|nr:ABC transporter ATP-binding protein [Planctomycetales bacterium]
MSKTSAAKPPVPMTPWQGPMIELQQVTRIFGTTRAVDEVSFMVPRGSVFGYIGPNGAGKTT